ncbi:MAG: response regulator transcription factor [Desulfobacteraceae bacterium]|nr:response regulator transcription factor [Desulfobacteraceae bacterium]
MAKEKVLVVDDEEDILELVRYNLQRDGYVITCTSSGEKALKMVELEMPDLIVLDLMLPGINGLEMTRKLKAKKRYGHIPIIILSAKGEETDVVTGLEMGADDYVTKPFSPRILAARVKNVLRRHCEKASETDDVISINELTIHPGRREVTADGNPVQMTYTEFQILFYLARRPGWVSTRTQIVDAIRGSDYPITDRSVDVQIVGLRKKLGSLGKYIQTVRGVGYRFKGTS